MGMGEVLKRSGSDACTEGMMLLTDGLADSCGGVHLVAAVTLTLVPSFQVNTDLATDPRVLTFVYVCEGMKFHS